MQCAASAFRDRANLQREAGGRGHVTAASKPGRSPIQPLWLQFWYVGEAWAHLYPRLLVCSKMDPNGCRLLPKPFVSRLMSVAKGRKERSQYQVSLRDRTSPTESPCVASLDQGTVTVAGGGAGIMRVNVLSTRVDSKEPAS